MVKGAYFNQKSPIEIGINVKEGLLRIGTPLVIPTNESLKLGYVQLIELNKKPIEQARAKDRYVAVKIIYNGSVSYGRQFDDTCQFVSKITRDSIYLLKNS